MIKHLNIFRNYIIFLSLILFVAHKVDLFVIKHKSSIII